MNPAACIIQTYMEQDHKLSDKSCLLIPHKNQKSSICRHMKWRDLRLSLNVFYFYTSQATHLVCISKRLECNVLCKDILRRLQEAGWSMRFDLAWICHSLRSFWIDPIICRRYTKRILYSHLEQNELYFDCCLFTTFKNLWSGYSKIGKLWTPWYIQTSPCLWIGIS